MHIAFDNVDFAEYLLNSTKPARNKFFKRITEYKNFQRIVHQLGLMPVVTLVRLSQEEVNVYKSSKQNRTYIGSNMSNQIKTHNSNKEKLIVFNKSSKEFSKSSISKKHKDLFSDNKSLKIHPNKLIHRSHSKQSTKENKIKKNEDSKKFNYNNDKNLFKNKYKYSKHRKEDSLSPKRSISSSSKTKSHKTGNKCESNHKTNCNENKNTRPKKEILPTLKDEKKYSNSKKLTANTTNEVNLSKLDTKNSSATHSKTCNNINKLKINEDIYKPKKITERRKSFHHGDKAPHNVEEEKSIFKRRNSHLSPKTTYLESESRKRSNSELPSFGCEDEAGSESKRSKTAGFSAFSSLDDTEVITIDKTKILPPIDDFNSPYVSFGDFLKNKSIPLIESYPKGPEFLCTPLGGDKLLIKKRNIENQAIVIDITDDEPNDNNVIETVTESPKRDENSSNVIKAIESSSKITTTKKLDVKMGLCVSECLNKEITQNATKSSSKITTMKELDIKMELSVSESLGKKKTQKATESSPKINPKINCDVIIKNNNKINGSNSLDNSFYLIDNGKEQNLTEKNAISFIEKSCNDKIKSVDNKTNVVKKLNNRHESSSDSINKKKTQMITERSSKISPEKNSNVKMKNSDHKTNVAESLDNRHESSSDSIKRRRIQKANQSSSEVPSKNDSDIKIKSSNNLQRVVEDLDINCNSDKFTSQKFQILCTKSAVEYITSDLVSVLNVYVDYKQYTEKLNSSENKETNIKDYFVNNRLKFLKSLCKKLQNVKVHTFKTSLFFDSLIESIKIHIAPKEILNEKTISRFIHNVLILFKENCSTPDDYYILYNHVVSIKSLQYLDQKSFSLSDSVDKHIFDSMNSFSVKLKRSKDTSNSLYKDSTLPQLYCIDNSPEKITDVTPGNSLPCINTGETLVKKISPSRSSEIDMVPQISIMESSHEKNNTKENLIDLLQNIPAVANNNCTVQSPVVEQNNNNQSATTENKKIDVIADYIESKLLAIFNEHSSVIQKTRDYMEKPLSTNHKTSAETTDKNVSHQTKTVCSPNSDDFDNMNFFKNINPNKSYLAPMSTDINAKINTSSSVPHQTKIDNAENSVTPVSTSMPKTNTSNKQIKILNDIVLTPAIKEISLKPQSNPSSLENVNTNNATKPNDTVIVNPPASQNLAPPNKFKTLGAAEKNKVTKRQYIRRKPLSERKKRNCNSNKSSSQLTIDHSSIENNTALPRPFPIAGIQNDTHIPNRVATKDCLNSKPANASVNPPPSYMMNQILEYSKPPLKTTVAQVQLQHTTSSNLPRQYSHPVQRQQTASTIYASTQQSQPQIQVNPVPLSRQLSATSQLQEPLLAPTLTGPLNLLSSMTQNISKEHHPKKLFTQSSAMSQLPPPSTISQQLYLPNTSESVCGSSYTPSFGGASLNLQSSNSNEKITRQVTLEQVVERTLIHQTQTVQTQQTPNLYVQNHYMYENHLLEKELQAFRSQQAEQQSQEQLRQQKHQEMLRQQKYQEMLKQQQANVRLMHQQKVEMLRYQHEREMQQQQQELLRKQNQQEMINLNMNLQYNNNKNIATMYNSNNYYSASLGQVAQPKPNEYTYPTYQSGYPTIYNNFMPQLIRDSYDATRALHYLNNQHSNQNDIRRNTVSATSTQCNNNNLIYPPTTSSHPNFGETRYINSAKNNYFIQPAKNPIDRNLINVPMRNNTVPQTSVIVQNNSAHALRPSINQIETEQLLRTNTAVAKISQNQAIPWKQNEPQKKNTNNSLEQHVRDLEEFLNKDTTETRSTKEMDNSVIRNSSRDSGYMTPNIQKDQTCAHCFGVGNFFCSGCENVYYCSEDCQMKAWPTHQKVCCFNE